MAISNMINKLRTNANMSQEQFAAVSYTHLDVYKRQGCVFAFRFGFLFYHCTHGVNLAFNSPKNSHEFISIQ